MSNDNGRLDINEITEPMRAAIARLAGEVDEIQRTVDAIERQGQEESAKAAAQVLQRAVEQAAPYRKVIADKHAAMDRFRVLIAREEQEAQSATETRHDLSMPEQDGGQQPS